MDEWLYEEIEWLEKRKTTVAEAVQVQPNGHRPEKASDSGTIGRARRTRTKKKEEAMQRLLEIVAVNTGASLFDLAAEIGRSKSTVGGYVSELVRNGRLVKGTNGWMTKKEGLFNTIIRAISMSTEVVSRQ